MAVGERRRRSRPSSTPTARRASSSPPTCAPAPRENEAADAPARGAARRSRGPRSAPSRRATAPGGRRELGELAEPSWASRPSRRRSRSPRRARRARRPHRAAAAPPRAARPGQPARAGRVRRGGRPRRGARDPARGPRGRAARAEGPDPRHRHAHPRGVRGDVHRRREELRGGRRAAVPRRPRPPAARPRGRRPAPGARRRRARGRRRATRSGSRPPPSRGGRGRPEDDMGVEIEITPAGKSTKRLTLLSGGEKSLTALAFLFAVFLARPCPFYILDEVEAALDDLNIDRFLGAPAAVLRPRAVHRRHPPEAHDGGRRLPLRRLDGGQRRLEGHLGGCRRAQRGLARRGAAMSGSLRSRRRVAISRGRRQCSVRVAQAGSRGAAAAVVFRIRAARSVASASAAISPTLGASATAAPGDAPARRGGRVRRLCRRVGRRVVGQRRGRRPRVVARSLGSVGWAGLGELTPPSRCAPCS